MSPRPCKGAEPGKDGIRALIRKLVLKNCEKEERTKMTFVYYPTQFLKYLSVNLERIYKISANEQHS